MKNPIEILISTSENFAEFEEAAVGEAFNKLLRVVKEDVDVLMKEFNYEPSGAMEEAAENLTVACTNVDVELVDEEDDDDEDDIDFDVEEDDEDEPNPLEDIPEGETK